MLQSYAVKSDCCQQQQAVKLLTRLVFETVGKIPKDFKPPEKVYVNALVI